MNTLSLGIQMAQIRLSVRDASGLGLLSYLTFLKVKATSHYQHKRFTCDGINYAQTLEQIDSIRYSSLQSSITKLVKALKEDLMLTDSLNTFRAIDKSLRNQTRIKDSALYEFNDLIEEIHSTAVEFLIQPEDNFGYQIMKLQSLATVGNWDHLKSFEASNRKAIIIKLVNCLSSLELEQLDIVSQMHLEVA